MHIEISDKPSNIDPCNSNIQLRVHHNGASKLIDVDGSELDDIVEALGSKETKRVIESLLQGSISCL